MNRAIRSNIIFLAGNRKSGRTRLLTYVEKFTDVMEWEGDDYIMVQRLRGTHNRIVLVEDDVPLNQVIAVAERFPETTFVCAILHSELRAIYLAD